ncbi:MAG: cytochrome c family protein [Desulfovibrio sp.]|uniref:cytochrome c family protein n=1 Tax=Desulfovibrio sp. 7SRBS1 TaxID=3378064 RepID=UPI003B41BF5D
MAVFRVTGMVVVLGTFLLFVSGGHSSGAEERSYVGNKACAECHEAEYKNYSKFSKKATSSKSVLAMASDLTKDELAGCYGCHATGYGQPGGFVSFEQTPEMGNAGCEVCHGPGSAHVESGGDPELIKGTLTMQDCETCHNASRVASFNFKPLLYGGAH